MTNKYKASALICSEIEQKIATGAYKDGEKLNEAALSEQFNVSRTPLREAFQILDGIGLVELIPNRGAFVRRPSMTRLVEMFEFMAELEAWCVKLATRRLTSAQQLYLKRAASDCARALKEGKNDDYYEANNRLHGMIYQASGNAVLEEETLRMHRRLRPFRRKQLDVSGRLEQSMQEHDDILAAMDEGDEEKAAELMRKHIYTLGNTYDQYLAALEEVPADIMNL
ncbi:DNA-binding transcriptional regulator, GntR family [Cohaesibacter marisflavi]|uniref:DNA-binding transcriptional regulator, GntR family n=1 Tax=Cohaesibacter marisflavi TaxID=655353 RepID=A0A1I5IR22_9HYPH|nr:GntR family transcriptional regulator [Cohaesibacter marisflavi]SFO62957.1 DNA-binding transcriptional regulator, GntR family [Cohaesibacter marisflavi]